MPQDVEVGAGYCGDVLFQRYPGQYRNPEMDSRERAHFNSFPGNHGPVFTDPDQGRAMVMKEMPGIGQVVVPVDHSMAGLPAPVSQVDMGAVYPSDHTMVGLGDDPRTQHGRLHWHQALVLALDSTATVPDQSRQLAIAFTDLSQKVVDRAIHKARKGKFASVADAQQFVRQAITGAAAAFLPQVKKVAAAIAESTATAAKPSLERALRAPAKGRGVGDWPGSMMGNWLTDTWNTLTGKPQSWYTRLSNIQDLLNITLAGVTAVGKDQWNQVASAAQGPTQDGGPVSGIDDYDTVVNDLAARVKSIIVTQNYVPSDDAINQADAANTKYAAELSVVQQTIPAVADQVRSSQQQVSNSLPPAMQSPAAVGRDVFVQTVADRAKAAVDTGTSVLTYIGIGAGVVAAVYAASKLGLI